jgi:O-antigen/teichoic acid export membrane protein
LLVLFGWGALGMAVGLTAATILTIPFTYYYLRVSPSIPNRKTLNSIWSYARYSIPGAAVGRVYNRFDVLLLGFLISPAAVAQYEIALKLTVPAMLVSNIVGNGLMSRVSNIDSKGGQFHTDIKNSLAFSSILSIPIFFGALLLSEPLVLTIYGSEYKNAAPLLIGLALFRLFGSQSNPLNRVLSGLDKPDINVKIGVVALCVNIVIGVPLTVWIGPIGVVVGTVIAESLKYGVSAYVLRQEHSDIPLLPSTVWKEFLAGGIMAIVVLLFRNIIIISSWLDLAAIIGTGAVVYAVVLILISKQVRITVFTFVRRR